MSKLVRLLRSPKDKNLVKGEKLQMICTKCGKRPATDPDGLCNHCKFVAALTEMNKKK